MGSTKCSTLFLVPFFDLFRMGKSPNHLVPLQRREVIIRGYRFALAAARAQPASSVRPSISGTPIAGYFVSWEILPEMDDESWGTPNFRKPHSSWRWISGVGLNIWSWNGDLVFEFVYTLYFNVGMCKKNQTDLDFEQKRRLIRLTFSDEHHTYSKRVRWEPFSDVRSLHSLVIPCIPRLEALAMDNGKDPAKFREDAATPWSSHGRGKSMFDFFGRGWLLDG